jgi:4a-hydroxytetrahydrobiopterin dehydratase
MKLYEQTAKAILKGAKPLTLKEEEGLQREIPEWSLAEHAIYREFRFKDFRQAMDFVNKAAVVANEQDHHPDILISYNKVRLTLTTHKINGLTLNDFIVAAKIDRVTEQKQSELAA